MLATKVRLRPCSARLRFSSSGRVTTSVPSSAFEIEMGSATVWVSVPFGPLTVTRRSVMSTSTPLGIWIGSRPMRDMSETPLPDVGEDFAAHAALRALLVGEQTVRCRDDRDAEAAEDARQVGRLRVDAQPGLAHAPDTGDRALAVRAVLELDDEVLRRGVALDVLDVEAGDIALLLQDLGDVHLHL